MRVLVLNDFLADWTGSEVVALEVAEHFEGTTSSFWCAEPAKSNLADWRPLHEIDLAEFDLVWAQQHAVFPLLDKLEPGSTRPAIVWASLSPYEVMDSVPASILDAYADEVVCNSRETAVAREAGTVFANAAPNPFHFERAERSLRNVLFVSNRQPAELLEAEQLLRARGLKTRFIGKDRECKRLEPSDLEWADCVVTIGKTVRYALASRLPVFLYDRFGGDGYLTADNYALNEAHNFSGRPALRKLTGTEIADEIVRNHAYWTPPPQPRFGDFLDALAARHSKRAFVRHPDLGGIAAMSSAIGGWISEAYGWRAAAGDALTANFSWATLRGFVWQKFRRSRLFRSGAQ